MATTSVIVKIEVVKIDEEKLIPGLRDVARKLDGSQSETSLDFSSVRRIHAGVVRELEELARVADQKGVKVTLRSVNVDVYKVLKLVKLSRRFVFEN